MIRNSQTQFPFTKSELEKMKQIPVTEIKKEDLVDIRSISIDKNQSIQEKTLDVARQMGNPFFVKCGDFIVKSVYQEDLPSITEVGNRMITL